MDRFSLLLGEKKKERVWERKGLGIEPDTRLADFSFSSFFMSFSLSVFCWFLEGLRRLFLALLVPFGAHFGGLWGIFFVTFRVSWV